jgi:hypothetical protein
LRYGVVRQDITVTKRANEADLDADVTVAGEYHTLAEFDPRQTRKGLSARPGRRIFGTSSYRRRASTLLRGSGASSCRFASFGAELERGA